MEEYIIPTNTQLTAGDLRIGVAGFQEADYIDEPGIAKHGLTAGLWIYVRARSELDRQVRVYDGQNVPVGGAVINILDVVDGPDGAYVRLSVDSSRV